MTGAVAIRVAMTLKDIFPKSAIWTKQLWSMLNSPIDVHLNIHA
jgi:hypothetical protein